jgi:hypothetical protein
MTVRLNQEALNHAMDLLQRGVTTHDGPEEWSEHAPTIRQINDFIANHGIAEYAKWHLAEDTEKLSDTRGRYLFPYGDFTEVHRCAVVAGEDRAAQHNLPNIRTAFSEVLAAIDDVGAAAPNVDRRRVSNDTDHPVLS